MNRPIITTDVIVWRTGNKKEFALIKRGKEPYEGYYALPGGHFEVDSDISIKSAALRELQEELGVEAKEDRVYYFKYFDAIGRDPRGRYIDFVFSYLVNSDIQMKAGDDASDFSWVSEDDLKMIPLAFDHYLILEEFIEA